VAGGSRDLDVGELPVIAGLREDADEAQLDVTMKMARSTSPEDARGGDGRRPKSSVAGEMPVTSPRRGGGPLRRQKGSGEAVVHQGSSEGESGYRGSR
jgi:hypothetical protein